MIRHLKWSHAEKQIARKAFELALDREFRNVIRRAKDMAGNIEQPTDLWDLEHYLTESHKRIDRTYDYRYSVLTDVFGRLIREGRLSEKELQGLGEDSWSLSVPTPSFWPNSRKLA
jgi:Asp-tRNA(Asn)/Glu-tRNA(Gln) amidotransferase B subunit